MADYRKVVGNFISFNANVQANKKDGGTYAAYRLIYTTQDGEAANLTKPAGGLKFNQALGRALFSLQQGDVFVMHEEKNAAGFWELKTVTKGDDQSEPMGLDQPAPAQRQAAAQAVNVASQAGRNFESAEERAAKQDFIIRQSSLQRAVEVLSIGQKVPINPVQVMTLATTFTNFVKTGKIDNGSVEDMEEDIPL